MSAVGRYVGRFAPSPTGPLHLGSLTTALASWIDARQQRGEWLVRIENIDPPREVAGASHQQLATLAAFGLIPDRPPIWQSQRFPHYLQAAEHLRERGLAFACHCSRSDVLGQGGLHRACRGSPASRAPAVRFRVTDDTVVAFGDRVFGRIEDVPAASAGDFVIHRADRLPAYQLAVVIDDAEQGVTDVVRGADLLGSTGRQILLQQALGLPTPRYLHLPLVLDLQGNKLSKSSAAYPVDADDPLSALREAWKQLGQEAQVVADTSTVDAFLNAAVAHFQVSRIPRRMPANSSSVDV